MIVVGYFFVRLDFTQRDHAEVIVITGVGFIRMIDVFKITENFNTPAFTNPENIGTVSRAGFAI